MHYRPTAHLLCGPAASGKSTYAKSLLDCETSLVHPDGMRLLLTGDVANQSMNQAIFTAAVPVLIKTLHEFERDIVIDATNTTRKARAPLIKQLKDLGYRVEVHVFRVPIEVCQARNAARSRMIPADVITRQFAQWQEPAFDEGMDAIVHVPFTFPVTL